MADDDFDRVQLELREIDGWEFYDWLVHMEDQITVSQLMMLVKGTTIPGNHDLLELVEPDTPLMNYMNEADADTLRSLKHARDLVDLKLAFFEERGEAGPSLVLRATDRGRMLLREIFDPQTRVILRQLL